MLIATIALAIITGIYAIFVWKQVQVMKETMRLDQRPWLGYRSNTLFTKEPTTLEWEKKEPPKMGGKGTLR